MEGLSDGGKRSPRDRVAVGLAGRPVSANYTSSGGERTAGMSPALCRIFEGRRGEEKDHGVNLTTSLLRRLTSNDGGYR